MTKRHTQTYDPIDAPGPRPTAQAGSVCASNDKTGPRPFPQMHSQRRKLAKVAHQTCPVADCAADEAAFPQRLYESRDIRVAHPFRRRGETAQSATLPGTSSPSTTLGGL